MPKRRRETRRATQAVVCYSRAGGQQSYSIAFGHWRLLEGKGTPEGIYALDTGCCCGAAI